jgi:CheY-like chemotaxis protein
MGASIMVCLVVEHSPEVRERLCLLLLELGILGVPVAGSSEAGAALESRPDVEAAIVDVDNRDVGALEVLADLRKKGVHSLAHSVRSDLAADVRPLVDGVLPKPFDEIKTAAALRLLLVPPAFGPSEKRGHIRVVPPASDLLRASFRITADSRLYSGRVRNISVGGAAIELFNGPADNAIRVGWRVPKLEFNLGTTPLTPTAVIVLYRRRLAAMRFESMTRAERAVLARYVYDRLTAS